MAHKSAWTKSRPGLSWTAIGAITSVVVGGLIHLPSPPASASTLIAVGEEPCVQWVEDSTPDDEEELNLETAISVEVLLNEETQEPESCLITLREDLSWSVPTNLDSVWAVVVAAGGAGSDYAGGGAGEVYEETELEVAPGEIIPIVIGRGTASGNGEDTVFGNVTSRGGQAAGERNGGSSGSGREGGIGTSGDDGVIAGGGGAGAGAPGTGGLIDIPEVSVEPSIDGFEEITPEPVPDPEPQPESENSFSPSEEPATDPSLEESPSESPDSEGELESEGVEELGPLESPEGQQALAKLRAGNGGAGVETLITGDEIWLAGGGAGSFSTGTSPVAFETSGGSGGEGASSWGGGGSAGEAGRDGVVLLRVPITEKALQTITWEVMPDYQLDETGVGLPTAFTTGDGTISYAVSTTSTSDCQLVFPGMEPLEETGSDGDSPSGEGELTGEESPEPVIEPASLKPAEDTGAEADEEGEASSEGEIIADEPAVVEPEPTMTLLFSTLGTCVLTATASATDTFQEATVIHPVNIVANRPVVTSVTPNRGPLAGGTRVQVTGRNFTGATAVKFGELPGTDLVIIDDETLEVTTPLRTGENFTRATVNVTVASVSRQSIDEVPFVFHNAIYHLNNERLRFGGNSNCRTGCADAAFSVVNSITSGGNLLQPFYRSGSNWFKLTYSTYPLNIAIGTGSGGNWTGSHVVEDPQLKDPTNPSVNFPIVSSPNFTETSTFGGIKAGYGEVIVRGLANINGSEMIIQNTYSLGANDSFVKITTQVENPTDSSISNVNLWVGTQDDYVGSTDGPTKTRGNLVNGVFTPVEALPGGSTTTQAASALLIDSGAEGVLFYSTTPNTNTSIERCCDFSNSYNQAPSASPVFLEGMPTSYHDGSYALHLPIGTLQPGATAQIIWFYAAGAKADLAAVAQQVASAAEPARPTVDRGDGTATLTWTAPNPGSGNTIIGYNYRYSTDGGLNWIYTSPDLPATPLSATVTGLDNSLTYEYQVRAIVQNSADPPVTQYGDWSAPSESSVLGVPFAPEISTSAGGDGKVTLTHSPPGLPAGTLTGYEYRIGESGAWTTLTGTGNPITSVITGLANGSQYSIQIRALNEYGPSEPSEAAAVLTLPTFTTTQMNTITKGSSFGQNLQAGTSVTAWALTAGSLPQNLTLNTTTGRIQGTPTTSGPYDFTITATNATGSVSQRFQGTVVPHWPSGSVQFGGSATTSVSTTISTADIQGLVITGGATVTVTGLPDGMTPVITNQSQAGVMPTIVLSGTPTTPGTYPVDITITGSNGRSVTQTVTLVVTAAPTVQPASSRPRPQANVDIVPPVNPPLRLPQNSQQNSLIPVPPVVNGPVLNNGQPPVPQQGQITVRRDDGNENAQARIVGNTGIEIQAGRLNLGLRVTDGSGDVRPLGDGTPEILIEQGARAQFQGTGFLPNSTVQVFLPLQGQNAVELARVQVDQNGALRGDARFLTGPGQAPIPVGPQVLQIVTVDENGRQVTVEMTVNVAQPGPTPDLNRETGEIPTLAPGQSFAMQAGLPVDVRIDIDPENRSTTIDGGDWTMELGLGEGAGNQRTGPNGELIVELERDELATVSGTGFMPDTRVDVWLFSTPTLLGTIVTEADGSFTGYVNVDSRVVTVGEHTLQLQGIGTDGYVRSANLGVVVGDGLTQEAEAWPWWWWAIAGGVLGLIVWFIFGRRPEQDDPDGELEAYDPSKRVYGWSVTENSPKRGTYTADLIGVSFARHS